MNKYKDTYKKYIITINSDNQTLKYLIVNNNYYNIIFLYLIILCQVY